MPEKFVPFDKLSKKNKRAYLKAKRKPPIPAPKVVPDKHKEIRDKEKSNSWN